MAAQERRGAPAFLVAPNRFHRLDLHAWKVRYPGLRVLTPRQAARSVGQVVQVDGDLSSGSSRSARSRRSAAAPTGCRRGSRRPAPATTPAVAAS
jgi:hypothetical protein